MPSITIHESDAHEAMTLNNMIPEFNTQDLAHFEDRYKGKKHIIITARIENNPAGYMIAYDRYEDGSIYCWMAGVIPEERKKGALTAMMQYLIAWSKDNGYKKIRIKTKNKRRGMISYLAKENYMFTKINTHDDIKENRLILEKDI